MKLLSVAIPCYNSQAYMRKCIDSLLAGGEDVEIIIVNDGSSDDTATIADEYASSYPTIVKAVHQENGGHGEAVNTGLANASGLYFKVVDSDDWVKKESFGEILKKLRELLGAGTMIDMFINNFVYEKVGVKRKKVMSYKTALPIDRVFTWSDVRHFFMGQYILMHSVIYRTELLRESGLKLPAHTFYVDNIFVYHPLPYVKTMYYMNTNFYRYYIGREDQSVNEAVMIRRIDQQLFVNKLMIDYFNSLHLTNVKMRHYMVSYLEIMMTVSSIMCIRSKLEENLEKKKELWQYLKESNKLLYLRLRFGVMGSAMNLPGKSGRKISEIEYKIARFFVGFN